MSGKRYYLDTSAYLSILLGEADSQNLKKTISGAALCSSTFFLLEAERNLVRMVRQGILSEDQFEELLKQFKLDQDLFFLKDLTSELCTSKEYPPVRIPRSADLVHLRTAKWFSENGGITAFASRDTDQVKAADEMGLPVI